MFTFLTTNLAEPGPLTWDMAKQIIQTQRDLAIYGLTLLIGITLVLIAGTWIWNVALRRHELKKAIESLESKMATKIEKEIQEKLAQGMKLFNADQARLFAITAAHTKVWGKAALWWSRAIKSYGEIGQDYWLRVSVDGLEGTLKNCIKLEDKDKKTIKARCSSIPDILSKEKDRIIKKLKEIAEETPT